MRKRMVVVEQSEGNFNISEMCFVWGYYSRKQCH